MNKAEIESIYSLSPMQQGMLFHSLAEPDSTQYVEQTSCRLVGELNAPAFEQAWQKVIDRHSILRTAFVWRKIEQPVQVVQRQVRLPFKLEDWSALGPARQEQALAEYLAADRMRPFDLTKAPLMRLALIRTAPDEHRLVWTHHHILLDGWSLPIVVNDFLQCYEALLQGREPALPEPRPYRDYINWLSRQDLSQAEQFWRGYLDGWASPTPLGFDGPATPAEWTGDSCEIEHPLPGALSERLQAFSRAHGITLSVLVQAAWAVLLHRYTREEDIVFGLTVSGRPPDLVDAESMVGLMINTLPVRARPASAVSVLEWLKQLAADEFALSQFSYCPIVKIQEWSQAPRGKPLFESLVIFENYPARLEQAARSGIRFTGVRNAGQINYPLALVAAARDGVMLKLVYDPARVSADAASAALRHIEVILGGMLAHPEAPPSALSLLSAAEERRMLDLLTGERLPVEDGLCAHQLFERQAERTPQAAALVMGERSMTYAELNARADSVAGYLARRGFGPEKIAAVLLPRSFEAIIAILGALKAGGAFMPMDPAHPEERLAYMLEDSGAAFLLTNRSLGRLAVPQEMQVIYVDEISLAHAVSPASPAECRPAPHNLAYVIYTSGSTGRPKGTLLQHRGLVNLLHAMPRGYRVGPGVRVLQFACPAFDASVAEIFSTLCAGATLVLAAQEILTSMPDLARLLQEQRIEAVTLPPTVLGLLQPEELPGLRTIISAGEALPVEVAARWVNGRTLINGYGPTETTVAAAWYEVKEILPGQKRVPIGRPLRNTRACILDEQLHLLPVGVPGELCIGGPSLARGYLNLPEMTAHKFIPDPFTPNPGERLYRTGDLVRCLPDGNLEYLGRIDEQVKLRGYRIEPGEVEAALCRHPQVRQAAVVVAQNESGDGHLAAFYIPADAANPPEPAGLRAFLKTCLPDYMLPAVCIPLEQFPLSPSGKIDRKALRTAAAAGTTEALDAYIPPATPTEELLAGIWAKVLKVDQVGSNHSFAELGGHSLLSTQVMSRVRDIFHVELPLKAIFDAQNLAGLAAAIDAARQSQAECPAPPLEPAPRAGELPLSFAQQRLWFLNQLEPESVNYNLPAVVRLKGCLDFDCLSGSLNALIARHETLRTRFTSLDGRPVQVILAGGEVTVKEVDLSVIAESQQFGAFERLARQETNLPFDLAEGPLLRAVLFRISAEDHLLLLILHHIITDGWSMGVLVRELAELYSSKLEGRPARLPPLPVQYADYAAWQRRLLQGQALEGQLAYWREKLAGLPPVLALPTDRPRPPVATNRGALARFEVSADLTARLKAFCMREGVTLYMALLAVYQALLHRYTGQEDIAVGTAIANRTRSETENLIGFFVNTLVIRTDCSGEPHFRDLVRRVRETCLEAYDHQDIPFEMLVEDLQPERSLSYSPIFQAAFDVQQAPDFKAALPGIEVEQVAVHNGTSMFDMLLSIIVSPEHLSGSIEYAADLFDEATIERFAGHFNQLLDSALQTPEQPITRLDLLTPAERQQILIEWNDTGHEYPQETCAHRLFEAWAERQPDAPAVILGNEQLSYRELDARASRLAAYLVQNGFRPGGIAGVYLGRCFEMVEAILGVMKAGGAYLPLDPQYPKERISYMLGDSQAACLITQAGLLDGLHPRPPLTICLDVDRPAIAASPPLAEPNGHLNPAAPAYVIYTSGSTGQPKGSLLHHRGLCNLIDVQRRAFDVHPGSRVLQFSSFSFDASVWETFMALGNGGSLVLAAHEVVASGPDLLELLRGQRVTHATLPPSVLGVLEDAPLPDLMVLISAGEACPRELVDRWAPGRRFFNAYGPSETTVCASMALCRAGDDLPPPIGRPISNTQLYVLDARMQPLPVGVPGELYIGGVCVGSGYLNRPELNAAKFVPDPFTARPGARLFKTGDGARFRADGNIEFLGRLDSQVKLRGFRIELGEIEAALLDQPGVRQAVACLREDPPAGPRLVAYIVPEDPSAPPERAALLSGLKSRLPEYMLPAQFVSLEALPLNTSGKVDRKKLPAPGPVRGGDGAAPGRPAQTSTEICLAEIAQALLGVAEVRAGDNFFELGGHSLLATQYLSRIRAAFQVDLPLKALFEHPTIAELAAYLDEQRAGRSKDVDAIAQTLDLVKTLSVEDLEKALEGFSDSEDSA